jgi:uncharacterized protein YkwD
MSKHRRGTRRRKIAVAVLAAVAVGTPTVALASDNWHGNSHHWWQQAQGKPSQAPTWQGGTHRPTSSGTAAPTAAPTKAAPTTAAPTTAAPTTAAPTTAIPTATTLPAASAPTTRVLEIVNAERKKAGCSPLALNAKLTAAAQAHSKDMADHSNMSHTGSDGSSPADRITRAGYTWSSYGENVAYGYSTPESVMAGWMASAGHKRNILDCNFKDIGIGLAQPGSYWTQDFGTSR